MILDPEIYAQKVSPLRVDLMRAFVYGVKDIGFITRNFGRLLSHRHRD